MSKVNLNTSLYKFLKRENLLDKFRANCLKGITNVDTLYEGFTFENSKEGAEFWLKVADIYDSYIEDLCP